jgi:hypothetical protein
MVFVLVSGHEVARRVEVLHRTLVEFVSREKAIQDFWGIRKMRVGRGGAGVAARAATPPP